MYQADLKCSHAWRLLTEGASLFTSSVIDLDVTCRLYGPNGPLDTYGMRSGIVVRVSRPPETEQLQKPNEKTIHMFQNWDIKTVLYLLYTNTNNVNSVSDFSEILIVSRCHVYSSAFSRIRNVDFNYTKLWQNYFLVPWWKSHFRLL